MHFLKISCWVEEKDQNECCSELNSFLFCFGFQMANQHRCTGQTAVLYGLRTDTHMLPCLISNKGTWKRSRGLGLSIEEAEKMATSCVAWSHLMSKENCFFGLSSTLFMLDDHSFLTLTTVSTCQIDPSFPAKPEIDESEPKFDHAQSCYRVLIFHFPWSQVALVLTREKTTKILCQ